MVIFDNVLESKDIRENILRVRERIDAAVVRSGRNSGDVVLIAVSKTQPLERIEEALGTGLIADFGENRVQEGMDKIPRCSFDSARWHLIGHLQRNKARKAVELFDVIQSVDSVELALTLERIALELSRRISVLMEVNTSMEPQKHGVAFDGVNALSDCILSECPSLDLGGLMTVGPLSEREFDIRKSFALLRNIRDGLRIRTGLALNELSMGMSGDFELAIEEGSTMVRIGSAIFGSRKN